MSLDRMDIVNVDLDSGTAFRSFAIKTSGEGDGNANVFGFRCVRNGKVEPLTGCSCRGYFMRPDKATVILTGNVSGNIAAVRLTPECFDYEGVYTLVIKLISGDYAGTMRIVDGAIVPCTGTTIIDPTGSVPDVAALEALIAQAETAATDNNKISISASQIESTRYRIVVTKDS